MSRRELLRIIRKAEKEKVSVLNLSNRKIAELPQEIGRLRHLTQLYLSDNQLKKIPREVFQLKNLTMLYLNSNQLAELPGEIVQLKNLTILDMSNNQLRELPREIVQLKNLNILYLRANQIRRIPTEIVHLRDLNVLDLDDNPLIFPPVEIVGQGLSAIMDYLKKSDTGGQMLYEAKLMLMGQGGVGKTCLTERLILDKYKDKQPMTEGINIQFWRLPAPDNIQTEMTLNVWDFGGQEIYHATHQFFLTRHSLYLLVWDPRQEKEYERLDYWLNIITTFAEDSPVILVMNKADERDKELNIIELRRRYPQIVMSAKVSAKEGIGIEELREAVRRQAWELPMMGTFWPSSWLKVRKAMESAARYHVPYANYLQLCRKLDIEVREAKTLSHYLHDMGVIMHFQNDPLLKDTIILKPEWGTGAVYKVLDAQIVQQCDGILYNEELPEIWKNRKLYPPDKYPVILRLMANFELAFPFGKGDRYIVAEFLPRKPVEFDWNPPDPLQFEYHYEFLPAGLISRLIVRLYELLIVRDGKPLCWQEGAYLEYKETQAKIRIEPNKKILGVQVRGRHKKEFLSLIRSHMDSLHNTITRIRVKEKIPCICSPGCEHRFDYDVLLEFERKNKATVTCEKSIEDVSVEELLDRIEISEKFGETESKRVAGEGRQSLLKKVFKKIMVK